MNLKSLGLWLSLACLAPMLAAEPPVAVNMTESEPLFAGGTQFYFAHRHTAKWRLFDGTATRANTGGLFTVDHWAGLGVNWGAPRSIPGEWTLSANLPFLAREVRAVADGRVVGGQVYGLGDVALAARARYLWWVPGADRAQEGASLSLAGILTLPTGATTAELDGRRLPRDLQPGDGACGLTFAHIGSYSNDRLELIMTTQYQWRSVGVGRSNYDFGDEAGHEFELKYRVIQERFPGNTMFLMLALGYERADFDRDDGRRVRDSGGQALNLMPRIQWHPRPWFELKAKFEIPLWRDLNGVQLAEDYSVRASAAWRF